MIISLEGIMGSGKSTAGVKFCKDDNDREQKKVISNMHLRFPYTKFDLAWFLEHITDTEIMDCDLLLDEPGQLMDARSSQTKMNKLWTYFVVQTRKRGVDLYLPVHSIENIDVRIRRAIDIRGSCRTYQKVCPRCKCRVCKGTGKGKEGLPCKECNGVGGTGTIDGKPCLDCRGFGKLGLTRVFCLDRRLHKRYVVDCVSNDYWPWFDTGEMIPLSAKLIAGIDVQELQYSGA